MLPPESAMPTCQSEARRSRSQDVQKRLDLKRKVTPWSHHPGPGVCGEGGPRAEEISVLHTEGAEEPRKAGGPDATVSAHSQHPVQSLCP